MMGANEGTGSRVRDMASGAEEPPTKCGLHDASECLGERKVLDESDCIAGVPEEPGWNHTQ